MRRVLWIPLLLFAASHAHMTAAQSGKEQAQMEQPPDTKQVQSARPVRTTPGGMLDAKSMKQIQAKLSHKGYQTSESGQLDEQTQAALRKFQAHEHMASTGLPDFDTLRRLGLDPHAIYLGGTERQDQAKHDGAKHNEAKR